MLMINRARVRLTPHNRYRLENPEILVWTSDIAHIRNNPNIEWIEWGSSNLNKAALIVVSREDFLYAIDNRLGTRVDNGDYVWIELPFSLFPIKTSISPVDTTTVVDTTVSSWVTITTPTTFRQRVPSKIDDDQYYEVYEDNGIYKIDIHGKTKTYQSKKTFKSPRAAMGYLRNNCSALY